MDARANCGTDKGDVHYHETMVNVWKAAEAADALPLRRRIHTYTSVNRQ